ncbi:MAG: periplasmic polysaccharide biosynthesis/export protein [Deltaproteobacteria bacterium]|nr:periplasmic polysaccharide biosynthesis/export protein [Deltaproteobacteria bacterium]
MRMGNWNLLRCLVLVSAIAAIAVTPAPAVAKDYVIGVADVIAVSVLDNRELDAVATVNPGGKIALPLVGEVQASGLTAAELTQRLTDEYAKKVKSPVVTVSLREVNSYRFYFVGKVAKPGMYASRSEVTLLQAISIAGGILDGADLAQAYVARGKDRVPVDFVRLMRQGDLTQNITLNADDTIVLPDNPQHVIYVMGEVKLPGMLPFVKERNWTATKAVAAVGGFTQFAGKGRSYIIREDGGRKLMIPIDFNDLMKNPEAGKDVPLSAGDILVVPQSLF